MLHVAEHKKNLIHYIKEVLGVQHILLSDELNIPQSHELENHVIDQHSELPVEKKPSEQIKTYKLDREKIGNILFVRYKAAEPSVFEGALQIFFEKLKLSIKKPTEQISTLEFDKNSNLQDVITQIRNLKPGFVFLLGISGKQLGTSEHRGQVFRFQEVPTIITLDPEELLMKEELKRGVWEDIKIAIQAMEN